MITQIGIDADDTLWDEASRFEAAEAKFLEHVAPLLRVEDLRSELREFHFSLLQQMGYGPEGYYKALETFCRQKLEQGHIEQAISTARHICNEIMESPFSPLPGITESLEILRKTAKLTLVTKGDPAAQRRKLESSGLSWAFSDVVIVKHKSADLYRALFGTPKRRAHAAMIGNSLKSDVLPAIEAGAYGIFVPHYCEAPLEVASKPERDPLFREFNRLYDASIWLSTAYLEADL